MFVRLRLNQRCGMGRIPSKKWRELIKKVWEADPLLCPHCQHEMRIVALPAGIAF
jgi:hypothetical protein